CLFRPKIHFEKIAEPINTLIDSGASLSVISEKLSIKLNLRRKKAKTAKSVILADGKEIVLVEKTSLTAYNPNNREKIILKIYIMSNLAEELILGQDSLKKLKIQLSYEPDSITVLNKNMTNYNLIDLRKPELLNKNNAKLSELLENYKKKIQSENPIKNVKMKIELTSEVVPKQKLYPIAAQKEVLMKKEISELEEKGIIVESQSHYGAPSFTKIKSDGTARLLVDYRLLNKITKEIQSYFPSIDDAFHKMVNATLFSKIDLRKGFYQIEIDSSSQEYTGFTTPMGKFHFTRTPFGLVNAPKFFQNTLTQILRHVPNTAIFVDDIIAFSTTEEEHLETLNTILEKFSDKNVIINLEKSEFMKEKISYLGFTLEKNKYQPDQDRLKDFREWRTPKNRTELQKILGTINWYRKYIKDCSSRLSHLYQKLEGKTNKVEITPEEMKEINIIYDELKKDAELYFPDLNKTFYLNTDASEDGIGAILYQDQGIIGHFSRKLKGAQKNYSVTEKELLAVKLSVEHFRKWLIGSKIQVLTDNKNLIGSNFDYDKKTARWKAELSEYNIQYKHISGAENCVADTLSRKSDKEFQITAFKNNENLKDKLRMLTEFHITYGHPGIETTYHTIKIEHPNLPNTKALIREQIKRCDLCQKNKHSKHYGKLTGKISTSQPLKDICIDIFGPFSTNEYINNNAYEMAYIILIVDRSTRITKTAITDDTSSANIAKIFEEKWLNQFKKPTSILSDQGKSFIGTEFQTLLKKYKIKHRMTSTYNPTGNSIVERQNQTVAAILRIYKGWDLNLIQTVLDNRFNKTYHSSIRDIPERTTNKPEIYTAERKNNNKKNKNRVSHKYKIEDLILLKNFKKTKKTDSLFIGPFTICDVSEDNQRVKLKSNEIEEWHNIKNIKPYWPLL
ncbi:pol polyprotein, partial [Pseudoloma neurophilia]